MKITNEILAKALVEKDLIKEKSLKVLLENAKNQNIQLEDLIFERGIVPDEKLGEVIAGLYKVPFIKLGDKKISENLLRIVPYTLAANQFVIPFDLINNKLSLALSNPHNHELINFIEKKSGFIVDPFYATKKNIKASLRSYNSDVNSKFTKLLKGALKDLSKIESLKDAAKILDTIILFAFQNNASDIHIEPNKEFITIRYRIDGLLQTIAELPVEILELLTTRVKVLANLRTDEHRAAQDGRFKIDLQNNEITLRVSILPTYEGEKTVLRLLSSINQELNIESLGYSKHNLGLIHESIVKTNGIILITGPTGSGKSTTMYSILKLLNSPEINISTIEDPIEYRLEGVNQIQVNPKTNLTFAAGLRSLLRQDPDILMVGEIRDAETAGIAINSALTGHLVLATLHTNDVASTLPRLLDMGIEPFLVSATVKLIVSQRLVRKICDNCKKEYSLSPEEAASLSTKFNLNFDFQKMVSDMNGGKALVFYTGEGCAECNGSGFKGRISIAEAMSVEDEIRKLILLKSSPKEIDDQAKKEGFVPIFTDGVEKALAGKTTIEEVLRVMRS
jgi:type IV pilus assembly protein PilB